MRARPAHGPYGARQRVTAYLMYLQSNGNVPRLWNMTCLLLPELVDCNGGGYWLDQQGFQPKTF